MGKPRLRPSRGPERSETHASLGLSRVTITRALFLFSKATRDRESRGMSREDPVRLHESLS